MGRKSIPPNEKKQLVRLFAKKSTIDLIGEEKLKIEFEKKVNQLQKEATIMNYDPTDDLEMEIEKSKHDLFWECEDMPDEAINYVHELENKIRIVKDELKCIQEAMQVSGKLTFYINRIGKLLKKLK